MPSSIKSIQTNNENEEEEEKEKGEIKMRQTYVCITYQEVSPFNTMEKKKRTKISDKFQR